MESGRRSSRYRVHLSVSYDTASEFVREYAENLSVGGMFIANASGLAPLDEIVVEVSLPGYGSFRVKTQVCHVMPTELAKKTGSQAGAGLAITESPAGFQDALSGYLMRLGGRADHLVLASLVGLRELLVAAGYKAEPLPDPGGLLVTIARTERPVLAVIVGQESAQEYRAAAIAAGDPELVMVCEGIGEFDSLLESLDNRL